MFVFYVLGLLISCVGGGSFAFLVAIILELSSNVIFSLFLDVVKECY